MVTAQRKHFTAHTRTHTQANQKIVINKIANTKHMHGAGGTYVRA